MSTFSELVLSLALFKLSNRALYLMSFLRRLMLFGYFKNLGGCLSAIDLGLWLAKVRLKSTLCVSDRFRPPLAKSGFFLATLYSRRMLLTSAFF